VVVGPAARRRGPLAVLEGASGRSQRSRLLRLAHQPFQSPQRRPKSNTRTADLTSRSVACTAEQRPPEGTVEEKNLLHVRLSRASGFAGGFRPPNVKVRHPSVAARCVACQNVTKPTPHDRRRPSKEWGAHDSVLCGAYVVGSNHRCLQLGLAIRPWPPCRPSHLSADSATR
jgi:hypothetical protein